MGPSHQLIGVKWCYHISETVSRVYLLCSVEYICYALPSLSSLSLHLRLSAGLCNEARHTARPVPGMESSYIVLLSTSHVSLSFCEPFRLITHYKHIMLFLLQTTSQAILLKNLPSLLTAQGSRHLLLTAAHCSVRRLSVHHHLACCVAACARDHSDQAAAEVLLEAMTELAYSSPPSSILLPSQSLVSDLAECCAVLPDLCSDVSAASSCLLPYYLLSPSSLGLSSCTLDVSFGCQWSCWYSSDARRTE